MYITLASVGWLTAISIRPDTTVLPLKIGPGPRGVQVLRPSVPGALAETPAPNSSRVSMTAAFLILFSSFIILSAFTLSFYSLAYLRGNVFFCLTKTLPDYHGREPCKTTPKLLRQERHITSSKRSVISDEHIANGFTHHTIYR